MNEIDNARVSSDNNKYNHSCCPSPTPSSSKPNHQLNMIMNKMTRNMNDEQYEFSFLKKTFSAIFYSCVTNWQADRSTDRHIDGQSLLQRCFGAPKKRISSYKNKANTYKSRARLTDKEWLRMTYNDFQWLIMT